jgi:hypothetical protein
MKNILRSYSYMLTVSLSVILWSYASDAFAGDNKSPDNAGIKIEFNKEDSIRHVTATVFTIDSAGNEKPVPEADVTLFAKKSFGMLPLGDAQSTDKNGEVTIDFPTDLPGDSLGNIVVVAKVEDNEKVGTLEEMRTVSWGVPRFADRVFHQRALWASGANAPLPLVITVCSMVAGVWSVILYIVIQLFKIKNS